MKKSFALIYAFFLCFTIGAQTTQFNEDWRFHLGDLQEAKQPNFEDKAWQSIRLPHDWAFENGYSEDGAQSENGGYAMGGIGWYRKNFTMSKRDLSNQLHFIDFDGVYMNSEVWVNGAYLGKRPYGYISFSYELTPHLQEGENVIAVRVDNSLEPSARWYHGCGIYGDVRMRRKNNSYFVKDGTFVQTPTMSTVAVTTEIEARKATTGKLRYEIYDQNNKRVADGKIEDIQLHKGVYTAAIEATIEDADLWSPESPALYTLNLKLTDGHGHMDKEKIRFGFRTIKWCANNGFYLNGKQYKLQGVSEHLEGGPTGALMPEVVLRWRLQKLKDMGCNAVRVAHNPYLPNFYALCDEMGILVMDEIFDGWKRKAVHDYGSQAFDRWWQQDLKDWIRRDRNHPSIFLYSVGNETHGPVASELVEACHRQDPTRLVTSGDCNADQMDVYGVNGRSEKINDFINKWDKRKPFVATENPHTWQVRGYYRTQTWYRDGFPNKHQDTQEVPDLTEEEIFHYDWIDPAKRKNAKQVFNSSYDNAFVRVTSRHLIEVLRDKPWFSGAFRWTGFDYLGEAGYVHGGWPFRAFQSGALDLAGFEKDLYYLYQAEWSNKDMVHILPHWTHPVMKEGTEIPVWVYTSGDEVELFQDGQSLGKRKKGDQWDEIQCEWLVPWKEGKLEAVAYRQGKEIARTTQQSSGAPSQLVVSKDDNRDLINDGSDVAILSIAQMDDKGVLYPYGENRVFTKLFGDARMLSFENGSPVDVETNFGATSKECFFGLNRMFIQSTSANNKPVSIVVGAICGDKKLMLSDQITISLQEVALSKRKPKRDFEIYYTTDGTEPTKNSKRYTQSFPIQLNTTVKAVVFDGNEKVLSMQEEFSQEDGLYWGK